MSRWSFNRRFGPGNPVSSVPSTFGRPGAASNTSTAKPMPRRMVATWEPIAASSPVMLGMRIRSCRQPTVSASSPAGRAIKSIVGMALQETIVPTLSIGVSLTATRGERSRLSSRKLEDGPTASKHLIASGLRIGAEAGPHPGRISPLISMRSDPFEGVPIGCRFTFAVQAIGGSVRFPRASRARLVTAMGAKLPDTRQGGTSASSPGRKPPSGPHGSRCGPVSADAETQTRQRATIPGRSSARRALTTTGWVSACRLNPSPLLRQPACGPRQLSPSRSRSHRLSPRASVSTGHRCRRHVRRAFAAVLSRRHSPRPSSVAPRAPTSPHPSAPPVAWRQRSSLPAPPFPSQQRRAKPQASRPLFPLPPGENLPPPTAVPPRPWPAPLPWLAWPMPASTPRGGHVPSDHHQSPPRRRLPRRPPCRGRTAQRHRRCAARGRAPAHASPASARCRPRRRAPSRPPHAGGTAAPAADRAARRRRTAPPPRACTCRRSPGTSRRSGSPTEAGTVRPAVGTAAPSPSPENRPCSSSTSESMPPAQSAQMRPPSHLRHRGDASP